MQAAVRSILGTLAVDGTMALVTHNNGAATVVNDAGLNFAASTVGGALSATATTGNIIDTGALTITGTSTFVTIANDATIILDQGGHAFTGALLITTNDTSTDTAGDVTINAGSSAVLDFGNSTIDGGF